MYIKSDTYIKDDELKKALSESLEGKHLKKVLILPPDYTRMYSGAGKITSIYYDLLKDNCQIDIMPALGTHEPMTENEWNAFFGKNVPFDRMIVHRWRNDVVKIGEVPGEFVSEVSEGLVKTKNQGRQHRDAADYSQHHTLRHHDSQVQTQGKGHKAQGDKSRDGGHGGACH